MEQYALYLRKSRTDDPNATIEEVLARHEKILLETARKMNLSIVKIFREVVSGENIADRPEMQTLLKEIDDGLYAGVLVVELERLARGNSIDQGIIAQSFQLSNTKIITPHKTIDPNNEFDNEMLEFGLFMSRREYKTINRRMQQGRLQSVKEGKYLGNIPPYGYIRKKVEKQKGFTLEIHLEQGPVIKMIFDLYVNQRIGISLIVRKLNSLHIPPAKGDVWVNATIQSILRNPVYCGKIRWNGRPHIKKIVDGRLVKERPRAKKEDWILADGLHEAIIGQETFDLAQEILGQNSTRPCPRDMPVKNPLAGLVDCGVCGRKMVRRPYSKSELPDVIMCPSTACPNISSRLIYVEEKLINNLEKWLENYKLNWELTSKEDNEDVQQELKRKAVKKLDEELLTLEKQLANIHDLLEQGIYSTDTFLERSRLISERTAAIQKDKSALMNDLKREEASKRNQEIIIPKFQKAIELYRGACEPAFKNKILHEILEKVVYKKSVKGRWNNKPDDFELTLYPKPPESLIT